MKNIKEILAIYWSVIASLLLAFILFKYGDRVEILTLIIGLIGGLILQGIFGTYFSASHNKPSLPIQPNTTTTNTSVEVNETTENPKP